MTSTRELDASELCVLVPTRGRPEATTELVQAWDDTAATAHLWFFVDDDDPQVLRYRDLLIEPTEREGFFAVLGKRIRLAPTLNREAVLLAHDYRYLGFMGDDHRPRTPGWDLRMIAALGEGPAIAYGNDLYQGENLPTAVFMTSDIVQALGYMCPPPLLHMYVDDAWRSWGLGIDRLRYLPDVIIEHLHPVAGKSVNDGSYNEAWAEIDPDFERWNTYIAEGKLASDIDKLKALL